jgi:hypothetical protein
LLDALTMPNTNADGNRVYARTGSPLGSANVRTDLHDVLSGAFAVFFGIRRG